MQYLLYMELAVNCLLALFLGAILGFDLDVKQRPVGMKAMALFCLGASILTFVSLKLAPHVPTGPVIAYIILGMSVIGAAVVIKTPHLLQGLSKAAWLWISGLIGILIGCGLPIAALAGTCFALFAMIVAMASLRYEQPTLQHALHIEVLKLSTLEKIEALLQKLDLQIDKKSIVKGDHIYLELAYTTTPSTQYLLTKRLHRLKGLGEILKL